MRLRKVFLESFFVFVCPIFTVGTHAQSQFGGEDPFQRAPGRPGRPASPSRAGHETPPCDQGGDSPACKCQVLFPPLR
jgi:hypothetical protein